MENKINLEEILDSIYMHELLSDERYELLKDAMLDFGKQLLELAAENAKGTVGRDQFNPRTDMCFIDRQSILDTIKQVE